MPSIEVPLIRPTAHTASGISLCFAADVIRSATSRLRSAIVLLRPSTPAPVTKQSNRVNVVWRGGDAHRFVLGDDRKSVVSGKSVSARGALGGRRMFTKYNIT